MIVHGTTDQRLAQIKSSATLMQMVRHHFSKDGLREQLQEHTARADKAEARVAVLREEIRLEKLKRESARLEQANNTKRRQLYGPRHRMLSNTELESVGNRFNGR